MRTNRSGGEKYRTSLLDKAGGLMCFNRYSVRQHHSS